MLKFAIVLPTQYAT